MRVTRENGVRDNKKAVHNGSKLSSGAFGAGSSLSFQAIKCKHFCQEKAEKPESSINATNQQKMQNGPKYKKSAFAYLSLLHLNLRQEILERLPIKKWTQIWKVAVEFYRRLFTWTTIFLLALLVVYGRCVFSGVVCPLTTLWFAFLPLPPPSPSLPRVVFGENWRKMKAWKDNKRKCKAARFLSKRFHPSVAVAFLPIAYCLAACWRWRLLSRFVLRSK